MVRQLGNPTWFYSFSAAETRWSHLLKTLGRLVEKKDYTDCEIENMTWQKESDLIQKNPVLPVTCARNLKTLFFSSIDSFFLLFPFLLRTNVRWLEFR